MEKDRAITVGAQAGNLELNVMMPLIAHNLLQSIKLLSNVSGLFATQCIDGMEANQNECQKGIEWGLSLVTALAPHIGYDQAAGLAKEAFRIGKTIREVALARKVLPKEKLDDLLNPAHMLQPTPMK